MEPAIQGQQGSVAAFKVGAALANGFALDEDTACRLFATHYNPRCQPPWSEQEIRHKIGSAARVASAKPRGHLLQTRQSDQLRVAPSDSPRFHAPTKVSAAVDSGMFSGG